MPSIASAKHAAFAALIDSGDHIAAERWARDVLAQDRSDPDALHVLGIVLHESGRTVEAIEVLTEALATGTNAGDILKALADAQFQGGMFLEAAASYRKHASIFGESRTQSLEECAVCQILAGDRDAGARALVESGTMPEGLVLNAEAVMAAARSQRLGHRQAIAILRVMAKARDAEARLILAQALWESDDPRERGLAAAELPSLLFQRGRVQEALEVYQSAVAQNLQVGDFRPRWEHSSLAAADRPLAEKLYQRDRDLYIRRSGSEIIRTWSPVVDAWGAAELRGVTTTGIGPASFELTSSVHGKTELIRTLPAHGLGTTEAFTYWRAELDDLLPGQSVSARLITDTDRSESVAFQMPAMEAEPCAGLTADTIGNTSAVLAAVLTPTSSAARFRFEYGTAPDNLDRATEWTSFPPPRAGRAYQRLYRHVGEWLPTCVKSGWVTFANAPPAFAGNPALLLGAPFAKDRNQLTGIGAHEMVAGVCFSQVRPGSRSEDRAGGRFCWPVGGGALDLRDAEVSFTLCGRNLAQRGAALHFWVSHTDHDGQGSFNSQWALTGTPFPDYALDGSVLQEVRLTLPNDPRVWTYTGNNPKEQGSRASRYRRSALNTTLSDTNAPSVLVFSFGDERLPPTGDLVLYDMALTYRDQSVLSRSAGAALLEAPSGPDDPLHLTCGARGYEDMMWASAPSPAFPLEFKWHLKLPIALTHFQINQHPYWPAREIELIVEGAEGGSHVAWSGHLPEGRPDRNEPSFVLHYFEHSVTAVAVTLRIVSGFHTERCGLDGLELYGAGATFAPDGSGCSLSAEVKDLTPGSTLYYRAVLDEDGEILTSELKALALPLTLAPVIESATPLLRAHNPDCYLVRANAMGLETELWGELTLADGATVLGKRVSLGSQPTGRHIYYALDQFPKVSNAVFRLRARNAAGDAALTAPFPCPQTP